MPHRARSEEAVLREVVDAMGDWIVRLPPSSLWRPAFEVIRRDVVSCVPPPPRLRLVPTS